MWPLVSPLLLLTGVAHASQQGNRPIAQRAADNWPIKTGYVAFGDSYGAGMGTGTTSSNACRVGSNNFGALLNKWTNNKNVDYQEKVCSGDTTVGLNRQIKEWTNPSKADVATVSIGGNDLGFSNLAWYCVLTPTGNQEKNSANFEATKAKATQLLTDTGPNGMNAKLRNTYQAILDKSGRQVSTKLLSVFSHSTNFYSGLSYLCH